jgi:hypothetical protein
MPGSMGFRWAHFFAAAAATALGACTGPPLARSPSAAAAQAPAATDASARAATATASSPASAALALGSAEVAALRERMRDHAKAHCGSCHQSSRPSHKPAAIAIYDLDRDDWHAALTVPRLQSGFPRRLNRVLDEAGRRDLQAFIAHEVALRLR